MTDFVKSKLPFNIVSSSATSGYITEISSGFKSDVDIVGHHQDTYAGLENEPLQSPFTKQHVGGNQHRHVSLNTGNDNDFNRPEAFKIKPESSVLKVYGPDYENVNKPRAQMWKGAKSPVNIENINSTNKIIGNFDKNYQIVQTSGRGITNNLIVDGFVASGNLTTQFISGTNNYSLPNLVANTKTIFVERFSAPGSKEESSRGALERYGEELSPNNSLTTRNIKIRQPFYNQLTQHSAQFGSGSVEGVSIHKVNRNTLTRYEPELLQITNSFTASSWTERQILSGSLATASYDDFGVCVAINSTGDCLVVTALNDENVFGNIDTGLAYIFVNGANGWTQQQILSGSLATETSDDFGRSIAMNSIGNIVVIGASSDENITGNTNTGLAYIFVSGANGWIQQQILSGSLATEADSFGTSVAINSTGDVIVVGALVDENITGNTSIGLAYIFVSGTNGWTQQQILSGSLATQDNDRFGRSIAISSTGERIVIGAYFDEANIAISASGLAYIFVSGTNGWAQQHILSGSLATEANDRFGSSVAMNSTGNIIVVGAESDENITGNIGTGLAYIFVSGANGWIQQQILSGSLAAEANDRFGYCVAMNSIGDMIVVGAVFDENITGSIDTGLAYIFVSGANGWIQQQILSGSLATEYDDRFSNFTQNGVAVSSTGNIIVVGAGLDENTTGNADTGLAYIYSNIKTQETLFLPQINKKFNDNFWIQNSIPRSDTGFAWITASITPYGIINSVLDFSFTSSMANTGDVSIETQTLLGSLSSSQQWYGTREQIRTGEHPVAQALRNKNIISVENIPQTKTLNNNSSITSKRSGVSTNYFEPPITNKHFPLQQDLIFNGDVDGTGTRIKYSLTNIVDKFANDNLNKRLGLQKTKISRVEFYNKLLEANKLEENSPIQDLLSITYKEKLYPSQINTFLSGTRARDAYIINVAGTGSDGFDRQFGTQRTFWRDEQINRKRSDISDGGYINSVKLSSVDEFGNSFNIVETGSLIDESVIDYQSALNVNSNINSGFFNSVSTFESSSMQEKYSSFQVLNLSGTQIFSRKRSIIGRLAGEFNEGYIDSYGIGESLEDLNTSIGAIYKNSLYKTALTDRPYASGSAEDLRDLVTLVHTEDDQIAINPKTRYLAFIGGAELSTGSATFYNTASNIFNDPNINIDPNSVIYSTMDNGLIRTAESASGKTPFFDSYEDFISDIRGYAKDYSVIPEFRISNHIKYYVSSSGGNFRKENNSIFELDGNGISERSSLTETSSFNTTFLEKYNFSDNLITNKTIENDYSDQLSANNITLTCKGIKKLLPYNGFYPQDRTIQLANLYSEYADNNLVGGTYNVSYENTVGADEIFSHVGTTSSLGRASSMASVQFNNIYYVAISYNYYQNNRGVVKLFSSSVNLPYEQWQQLSFVEYTGDLTGSYFGQSIVMLTASNGINLFVSEYGATKTGSLYQITSSDGVNWSAKTKILDTSTSLPISGNEGSYFGNYVDAISDSQRTILTVTEPGLPLNLNNTVNSIYVSGTDLYVGGAFTNVNKNINSNYIVKYDTINSSWSNLGTGPNNIVYTITGSGNDIYVGGAFTSVNGNSSIRRLAKLDTTTNTWSSLSGLTEMNSWTYVTALCLSGTDLYVGGLGSSTYKNILKYSLISNNINFLGFTATLNGVNGAVSSISVSGTDLYVGGYFTTATDLTTKQCNHIAKWSTITNTWSNLNTSVLIQEGASGNAFISASDKATGDTFGNAVAINGAGNRIVVGATGSAYGGPWTNLYTINTLGFSSRGLSQYYTTPYSASIYFGNSGLNFYLINSENNIQKYSVTFPYNLGANFTLVQNISFLGSLYELKALTYKDDGTKIYVAAKSNPATNIESDTIFQYAVSPSWGAPVAGEGSFSISLISAVAYDSYITGIVFNSTGTKMFLSHTNRGRLGNGPPIYDPSDPRNVLQAAISEFTLSTPWSVTTATHVTTLNLLTNQSYEFQDVKGLHIDNTGKELFIVGERYGYNYVASISMRNGQLNTAIPSAYYTDYLLLSLHNWTGVYVTPSKNNIFIYNSTQKQIDSYDISTRGFTAAGKAYVYTSGTTGWIQEGIGGNPYFTGSRANDNELYFSTWFGSSVAISSNGNRIAIAEQNGIVDQFGGSIGKINVYNSSSAGWQNDNYTYLSVNYPYLITHVFPGRPESLDISEDGSRIIAGGPQFDGAKGCVYIWVSGSTSGWVLEKDTSPFGGSNIITSSLHNSSTNSRFGSSVAISSVGVPRIVVGAPQISVGGVFSGRVHIFNSSSAGWLEENIGANAFISSSDKAAGDRFGFSVAINSAGNRIAIGASESTVSGISQAGKVYIFNSSSIGWVQETHSGGTPFISPLTKVANENFGYSVKLDSAGNRLVVGTESESGVAGNTYVFTSSSVGWIQEGGNSVNSTIKSSDGALADQFGFSVDINSSGNRIIVGARTADPGSVANSGKAYVYTTPDVTRFRNSPAGTNDIVNKIVVSGTDIYVAGNFTADKNNIETYRYILRYQPSTNRFSSVGNGLNNSVTELVKSGSDIYAGGLFTATGSYISKWNGTSWSSPVVNTLNNNVNSIAFSGNYLYVGGNFTNPTQRFAAYNTSTATWLQSNGLVYITTSSNNSSWSAKRAVISGSGFAKYSSIASASNGYHIFCTDESSNSGSIRVVTSSNASVWSSGALGNGIVITDGTTSTANLGQLPIDSTVFVSGGNERVYVFTADRGNNTYGSFYVFSSSVNSNWGNTNINSNKTILLTGTLSNILIPVDLSTTKTNLNISSIAHSAALYYSYGTARLSNSLLYTGKTLNGASWEQQGTLYSVAKNAYFGDNVDISTFLSKPVFFVSDEEEIYSLLSGKFATYRLNVVDKEKFKKFAALEPFFAPGILYNTIKSGIAVDWPCTTGSNSIVTSSAEFGLRTIYYPKNYVIKSRFDESTSQTYNAIGSLKSNINYRIPFENIIFPNEAFESKPELNIDLEAKRLAEDPQINTSNIVNTYLEKTYIYGGYEPFMNPIDFGDFNNFGPKRFSVPFVYRKDKTTDSGLYSLAMSNFLSEIVRFFLKDEKLITFRSNPDNKWKQFQQNKTYCMDVVIEKSPDLVMMEAYSSSLQPGPMNGRYFGYPVNKTNKDIWNGEEFTNLEKESIHTDPAYAPYTPPYFEGIARARILFKPTQSRSYTLDEILREATIENIYSAVEESASENSDALINKMPVESSIDLRGVIQSVNVTIQSDKASFQEVSENNNKIWVISPKLETPILDFSKQESVSYENSYIKKSGYGRGMWSGYGSIPDSGKGIKIRLEYPFGRNKISSFFTGSLLEQVGFQAEEKFIGRMSDNKEISEAIVAIPYLSEETEQTVNNETSFKKSNMHFIKIDQTIFDLQLKNVENNTAAILASENETGVDIQRTSISDMITAIKQYVIPPELNFLQYSDLQPFIMYVFEFKHTLEQQDLVDIWQGLKPQISINAEEDEIKINHKLGEYEFFGNQPVPSNIKWLVFKVKKKSEFNYFNVTETTKDDKRFEFNKIIGREEGVDVYSYNWPYDYFSLVELAKLNVEIEYKKKG